MRDKIRKLIESGKSNKEIIKILSGGKIKAGTWELPYTRDKADKLKEIIETPKIEELYETFGDDMLFDDLITPLREISKFIQEHLKRTLENYEKYPDEFSEKFEPEAIDILKKAIEYEVPPLPPPVGENEIIEIKPEGE